MSLRDRTKRSWVLCVAGVLVLAIFVISLRPDPSPKPLTLVSLRTNAPARAMEAQFKMTGFRPLRLFPVEDGKWEEALWVKAGHQWVKTNVVRVGVSYPDGTVNILAPSEMEWRYEVAFSFRHKLPIPWLSVPVFTERFRFASPVMQPSVPIDPRPTME